MSSSFSFMFGFVSRSNQRRGAIRFYENLNRQLAIRSQYSCQSYHNFRRDLLTWTRTSPISIKKHDLNIRHSAAMSSSPSPFFIVDGNEKPRETSRSIRTHSSLSSLSRSANDGEEKFKVMKIVTESGAIEKIKMSQTEIMMQTTLSPRDLVSLRLTSRKERKENWVGNTLVEQMRHPPTIMTRNNFILLSLGPVRAVAEPKAVYVFDVHRKAARLFAEDLSQVYKQRSGRIKSTMTNVNKLLLPTSWNKKPVHHLLQEEPTELVFLESVLADAVDSFTNRIRIFEPIVNDLLDRISLDVEDFSNANTIHQMAPLKEQLQSFEIFVTQAYDCVMHLLNDDEAMLQLLLTEQKEARRENTTVDFERHQHVEHLLGIYARRLNSIIQEAHYLLGRIESKQDYIELELDLYRNRIIRMNLDLAILATATGVTTALSGTFGMNMISGLEESHTAFMVVSATSAFSALSVGYFFRRMVSGNVIQQRAEQRIGEIKTMSNALSDMSALDYTVKKMIRGNRMSRGEFKEQLAIARHSKQCTDEEVDLLFNILNRHQDDALDKEDFAIDPERKDIL